jgi:hypothetical protein
MFPTRRNGVIGIAAALLALAALPGAAFAHDLNIYKAEAQVDLASDSNSFTVKCNPGDHALDGMWRIDHADQDNYFTPNELIRTAVDVTQAAPTGDDRYSFSFEKNAIGRAQVKLFVTCLGNRTVGGDHTHSFPATGASAVFVDNTGSPTAGGGFVPTTATQVGPGTAAPTGACPAGTFLVSPGFTLDNWQDATSAPTDPTAQAGRVVESNYVGSTTASTSQWRWGFDFSTLTAGYKVDYTTTYRCLKIKINPGAYDKHKLVVKQRNATPNVGANGVKEVRLDCGAAEKAVVAGFTIDPANRPYIWYLGMDPRIKQRAYRFLNTDSVVHPVTLKAACLNYRTT